MAPCIAGIPGTNAPMEVVVDPRTTIAETARRLRSHGVETAHVIDRMGRRRGIAVAQDVCAANRLGAGREPITRLVAWMQSTPAPSKARIRLVHQTAVVSAKTLCYSTMVMNDDDSAEAHGMEFSARRVG